MSIERQHGEQCLICEECDDNLEFFAKDEFLTMLADGKAKGWQITKNDDGEWEHRCPGCKPNRVSDARKMFGL